MPSLEWNAKTWNNADEWTAVDRGERWSDPWGNPSAQWHFSILPRVQRFLPANCVLEIAPGFGRWTQFLLEHCDKFIGVDLSSRCVETCQERFGDAPQARFYENDGFSLKEVDDHTVDFAFSFDSLVHAEFDVIAAYLAELARVLRTEGVAFIHHSNLGALLDQNNGHGRATTVSGEKVIAECGKLGLSVVSQERINWGNADVIDCLTVLTRAPGLSPAIIENPNFMCEASHVGSISQLYAPGG